LVEAICVSISHAWYEKPQAGRFGKVDQGEEKSYIETFVKK
jgi:hypothetical protein